MSEMGVDLPIHHFTGLKAIGVVAGRPVWPILGGSGEGAEPPADPKPPQDPEPGPEQFPADHPLVKTLAAQKQQIKELQQKSQVNADKAKRLDEIEEANRTELEKALARAEAAEKAIAEREAADELAKLREQVSKEKGVPAVALRGSTADELAAHADDLIAAGLKPAGPSSDGQGNVGKPIAGDGELSSADVVAKALGR